MRHVALDEQRHIGFGVKLLHDLAAEDPGVLDAVADLMREVTPVLARRSSSRRAGTARYTECFGFTLEEIYAEGARSFEAKLRAAGPAAGVAARPVGVPDGAAAASSAPSTAWRCSGRLPRRRPTARRRATRRRCAMLFDGVAPRRRPCAPRPPARSSCSGSSRTPSRGTCASTTASTAGGAGPRVRTSTSSCACRYDDWVDVVAGRLDPRRAVATGRLRPHGSPRALWRARGLFAG